MTEKQTLSARAGDAKGAIDDFAGVSVYLSDVLAVYARGQRRPEQNNYEVTRDSVRHIVYSFEDYNALYLDEEFARTTRWGGVIAPPGYLYSHCTRYESWLAYLGRISDSEGHEFEYGDNMSDKWEFLLPVRPGDTVH